MATTTYDRNRQSTGPAAYLGWSHANNRMEMMDLPGYLDSLQRSYDSVQQAYSSMAAVPAAYPWAAPAPSDDRGTRERSRRHGHREHEPHHHDHHDRDCGCDQHDRDCGCDHHHDQHDRDCGCDHHDRDCGCESRSCRCDCCVEDADIVVYAHCGETRVVPIEIDNDTRKPREDVTLEITDVRTAGGRLLSWPTAASVQGPLVLEACSTTRFEILVRVDCRSKDPAGDEPADKPNGAKAEQAADLQVVATRDRTDVDECVVGYFTVRLGGCLTRPIVVAVAALPFSCDSYRTGCACASCC
jgi:hypothetical protein